LVYSVGQRNRLFFGFAASTITPSWEILGQTLALGAILFVLLFGLRGLSTMLAQQSNLLNDQSFTISKTQEVVVRANQSLELLENTGPCLLVTLQFAGSVTFENNFAKALLGGTQKKWSFFDLVKNEVSKQKLTHALQMAKRGEKVDNFNCKLIRESSETRTRW
jgi:hypothetical protein